MIKVEHLVKRYGAKVAVDDLSFAVDRGEVVGFLGPNGAGKSTTLRVLAGFLGPTSGKVTVAGHDLSQESFEARQKIGYMPEAVPLYGEMRVGEYLAHRAELKRVPRASRKAFVEDAMKKAHVDDVATTLIGHLSKGYRQRVGLADALVAKPPLLVLDEPTAGLDPNQIREVRDVIKQLGKEHTVLLSTHILSEVEASCSRVVVITKGRLVAEGTLDSIEKKRRSVGVHVVARGPVDTKPLENRGKTTVEKEGDVTTIHCKWKAKLEPDEIALAIEELVSAIVKAGGAIREVRPDKSTLEEVFAELTTTEAEATP